MTAPEFFFGYPDAYTDRREFRSFESIPAYERAKRGPDGWKLFVSGVFGSGKSAILDRVASHDGSDALVWQIDEHNPLPEVLDLQEFGKNHQSVANVLINFFLWELANRILSSSSDFPDQAVAHLRELFPSIASRFLGKAAKAVKPRAGFIEIDLSEIIGDRGGSFAKALPLDDWHDALTPCLEARPAFILVDDAEMLLPGFEDIPAAADGLLYAAELVNDRFGPVLTWLVVVQWATYLNLKRRSKRFEKIDRRTERISWSRDELVHLLADRTRERLNLPNASDNAVLKRKFRARNVAELHAILDNALNLCVNGPRDLWFVCNGALGASDDGKIGLPEVLSMAPELGDLKLSGIEREFEDRYPSIRQFVEWFFAKKKAEWTPAALESELALALAGARERYGNPEWLTGATHSVIKVLYEIGLVGIDPGNSDMAKYINVDPFAHRSASFLECDGFVVHPAFRSALEIDDS